MPNFNKPANSGSSRTIESLDALVQAKSSAGDATFHIAHTYAMALIRIARGCENPQQVADRAIMDAASIAAVGAIGRKTS